MSLTALAIGLATLGGGHRLMFDLGSWGLGQLGSGFYWIAWGRSAAEAKDIRDHQELRAIVREETGATVDDLHRRVHDLEHSAVDLTTGGVDPPPRRTSAATRP
jgi:hypothetical protein